MPEGAGEDNEEEANGKDLGLGISKDKALAVKETKSMIRTKDRAMMVLRPAAMAGWRQAEAQSKVLGSFEVQGS